MDNPFPRYDLFSCELGMENDGYDDNNDNDENITIGSLEDFADLIFFLFSWNAFKNPNGIIDGRPKTCFWLRPAVYHQSSDSLRPNKKVMIETCLFRTRQFIRISLSLPFPFNWVKLKNYQEK